MSRSVNVPSNAVAVAYLNDPAGFTDDYDENNDNWEWFKDNLENIIKNNYKSFERVDGEWIGEGKVLLENNFAKVVVSEYCGCVSVALVTNEFDRYYSEESGMANIAKGWANKVADNIVKLINDSYPSSAINKIGVFSNGEAVFELVKKINTESA